MFPFPHTESNWNKPNVSSAARVCQKPVPNKRQDFNSRHEELFNLGEFLCQLLFLVCFCRFADQYLISGGCSYVFPPTQIMVKCKQFSILLRQNRQSQFVKLSSKTKQLCKSKSMLIPCIASSQQYHAHILCHLLHDRPLKNMLFFFRLMWTYQKAVEL